MIQTKSTAPHFNTLDELCSALDISKSILVGCGHHIKQHVRRQEEPKTSGGKRIIYAPSPRLKSIQRHIKATFLESYNYPHFIFGLGGNTLRDHALVHAGTKALIKVDLKDFFPSITYQKVYAMWASEFGLKADLARILTMVTTCDGYLQQGFPTSSHIAAIIALPMTNTLKTYCDEHELAFTQYVDDLNFSGKSITYKDIFRLVVNTARQNGFTVKRRKTKAYNIHTAKQITGVAVIGQKIRAPKGIRQRAIDALKAYSLAPGDMANMQRASGYARFLGHLNNVDGQRYSNKVMKVRKP